MNTRWITVGRDQIEAVAEAIEQTEISTVQATAILMMIVMARIKTFAVEYVERRRPAFSFTFYPADGNISPAPRD